LLFYLPRNNHRNIHCLLSKKCNHTAAASITLSYALSPSISSFYLPRNNHHNIHCSPSENHQTAAQLPSHYHTFYLPPSRRSTPRAIVVGRLLIATQSRTSRHRCMSIPALCGLIADIVACTIVHAISCRIDKHYNSARVDIYNTSVPRCIDNNKQS